MTQAQAKEAVAEAAPAELAELQHEEDQQQAVTVCIRIHEFCNQK